MGGDRVSTISLLGCSTSVVMATGPIDEEEEEEMSYEILHCFLESYVVVQ